MSYCISADGLKHLHAVFEDVKPMRFSAIKKIFPSMHIEATKGTKTQAEDYINKRSPFDEQGEKVICTNRHGEIQGRQGQRKDIDDIEDFIKQNLTPDEIFDISIKYRRYEKIVRDAYYRKREKETPILRDVFVCWHVGCSGSGKSFTVKQLVEQHGEQNIYFVGSFDKGFDKYSGQSILFMDEFRGQLKYDELLIILSGYKSQIPARYTNIVGLWDEVHLTSVFPPDILYQDMIRHNRKIDTYEQLRRRIDRMVYHYKNEGQYHTIDIPMSEYENYEQLKLMALEETPFGIESR